MFPPLFIPYLQDDVNSISISPDGQWVVSGSDDQTACIWDISNASLKCTLRGHKRFISSVVFSPAGNYLACGSWDNCVTLWKYDSEALSLSHHRTIVIWGFGLLLPSSYNATEADCYQCVVANAQLIISSSRLLFNKRSMFN